MFLSISDVLYFCIIELEKQNTKDKKDEENKKNECKKLHGNQSEEVLRLMSAQVCQKGRQPFVCPHDEEGLSLLQMP